MSVNGDDVKRLRSSLADMLEIVAALSPCDCEKCEVKIAHARALLAATDNASPKGHAAE